MFFTSSRTPFYIIYKENTVYGSKLPVSVGSVTPSYPTCLFLSIEFLPSLSHVPSFNFSYLHVQSSVYWSLSPNSYHTVYLLKQIYFLFTVKGLLPCSPHCSSQPSLESAFHSAIWANFKPSISLHIPKEITCYGMEIFTITLSMFCVSDNSVLKRSFINYRSRLKWLVLLAYQNSIF